MNSTRLKSEEIYRERVASDSLFTVGASQSRNSNSNDRQQQQQQQHQQQQQQAEDASEHEDVFGPPPLPKASESSKTKSKINILFGDTDSDDDLFTSASPSSKSIKSSEHTPSKTQTQKKKSLFDDDDDLFGSKDAPDVDLFAAAPVKTLLPKIAGGLFDELDDSVTDGNLFGEKPKSSEKSRNSGTVNSLFGEVATGVSKVSKDSVENLFGDSSGKVSGSKIVGDNLFGEIPKSEESTSLDNKSAKKTAKAEKVSEKKIPKGLFDDTEDSLDSDLFAPISKPSSKASSIVPEKSNALSSSKKSIFEDTPDSDLFGSSSSNVLEKNVIEKSSGSLFNNTKETSDIFETKTTKAVSEKDLFEDKSEVSKPKKKTTSIFDDSDEDDDLFGGSSFSKKINTKSSSIFEEDKIISVSKKMDEENKMDTKKVSIQTKDEKVKEESKSSKVTKKVIEKNSLFEDDDDDDDDDDLFGEKNKVIKKKGTIEKESFESKANTEIFTKSEAAPKKAFLAEIKQKLEKHNVEKSEISEPSVVDGAVSSKKEPPKSLKIQTTLPMPDESLSNNQQAPKKSVVSGKIKNLMGKMGDLKILSPTDTPPLWRKSTEEKSEKDDEQESIGDLESSGASTPSLVSGGSSPQTSGTNSRARDSPSLKSDNTEVAISFDEPAQVETLTSIASKNRVRIPTKRRPQSRHARQSALRHSGIDFDIVDASAVSPVNDQPNSDVGDAQAISDRLLPSRASHSDGSKHNALDSGHMDDRSEINSVSRNTTTNLLSPSTDEEDLFDVPPDLPEDPSAKEDSLFGRAPILSPVEPMQKPKKEVQPTKKETATNKAKENFTDEEREERSDKKKKETTASLDPLRDDSHDPIKDPSQLFAFVTKTPSPEKNKALLLNEDDDSLFSSSSKPIETKSKPTLDLFVDDDDTSSSDLFSSSKTRIKKPLKDTKIDLFGEASPEFDDDDSLFGSTTKKNEKTKNKESSPASSAAVKVDDKIDSKNIKTAVKDNFEESSDTDDIFASSKKVIPQKKTKSLFDDDEYDADDDDDIFAKPKSSVVRDSKVMADNGRPVVKKAITRDLTKTAEKIVEDPLSMLQDD